MRLGDGKVITVVSGCRPHRCGWRSSSPSPWVVVILLLIDEGAQPVLRGCPSSPSFELVGHGAGDIRFQR
jgi:hypothetical protein